MSYHNKSITVDNYIAKPRTKTTWMFLMVYYIMPLRSLRLGKRELVCVLFVRLFNFSRVDLCFFPLPLGVRGCLQLLIVTLPGRLFLTCLHVKYDVTYRRNAINSTITYSCSQNTCVFRILLQCILKIFGRLLPKEEG